MRLHAETHVSNSGNVQPDPCEQGSFKLKVSFRLNRMPHDVGMCVGQIEECRIAATRTYASQGDAIMSRIVHDAHRLLTWRVKTLSNPGEST
jgi:hypothetical protein